MNVFTALKGTHLYIFISLIFNAIVGLNNIYSSKCIHVQIVVSHLRLDLTVSLVISTSLLDLDSLNGKNVSVYRLYYEQMSDLFVIIYDMGMTKS